MTERWRLTKSVGFQAAIWVLAIGLFLFLHLQHGVISMLNFRDWNLYPEGQVPANQYLLDVLSYHETLPAFARRPLTSWLLEAGKSIVGAPNFGYVFIAIETSILALSAFFLVRFARILGLDHRKANASALVYFGGFSIVFAFFPGNYMYDEPAQYLFFFLTAIYWVKESPASVFFAILSCLSRETTLLLLPFLPVFFPIKDCWKRLIPILLPSILAVGAVWYFTPVTENITSEFGRRWALLFEKNFESADIGIQVLISTVLVVVYPFVFLKDGVYSRKQRLVLVGLILFNTGTVWFFGIGREARLYALPLLFLWPYLGLGVEQIKVILQKVSALFLMLAFGWLAYFALFYRVKTVGFMAEMHYFREYGVFLAMLIGLKIGLIWEQNKLRAKSPAN